MELKSNKKHEGFTIQECQDRIQRSLRTPMVKFLMEQMEKAGCKIGDNFIKAVNCKQMMSGGYIRGHEIMVCSNHMRSQDDVNQVVKHELIHAYDDCRAANLNWNNCAHQACTEIRAGHLSGDCHMKRELLRHLSGGGFMKIRGQEQECVRRRVMKSVTSNPFCPEKAAKGISFLWNVFSPDLKARDLLDLFESKLGTDTVFAIEISTDRNNWKSRGFGRVQFATLEAKSQALLLSHRDRLVFKSHSLQLSRTYDDIIPRPTIGSMTAFSMWVL
ncbi:hypothetical protein V6N13_053038 [Hibiscus sabdariffa]|uniref:Mitochondrial inner membrane protease ATP23 n=1 Tax=Hibiscus sabdariffa TaxID=183260 RepID=A0ABR2Q623_9ROSI